MKICVIPARGGSKRIPRKNIKSFFGQAIIGYSIKAALESDCFDQVIVSTDDSEIADLSKSFGASVPFIRPSELSNDYVGTLPVVKHAIEWFEHQGQSPSEVCCLYATAPFVKASVIRDAYKKMIQDQAEYCFTVTDFKYPIQRALKISAENRIKMFDINYLETRSQDLEKSYHDAGQFYWGSAKAFKKQTSIFSVSSTPFIIPRYLVHDIDTIEDWKDAELIYKVLMNKE